MRSIRKLMLDLRADKDFIRNAIANNRNDASQRTDGTAREGVVLWEGLLARFEAIMDELPVPPAEPVPNDHAAFYELISLKGRS